MRLLRVAVPTGIGDTLWAMTKVGAILRQENAQGGGYGGVHVRVCAGAVPHSLETRAFDFLQNIPFVKKVDHVVHPIHPPGRHYEIDGCIYLPSGKVASSHFDYLLIANHSLERGVRLEDFLPQHVVDWKILDSIPSVIQSPPVRDLFRSQLPFFVLYCSALRNYSSRNNGYNNWDEDFSSRWSLEDWAQVLIDLYDCFGQGLQPVITGAEYDKTCAARVIELVRERRANLPILDLCGTCTTPETLAVLRQASLVVGYPSGIPIAATFLGRPTVMFYNSNPILRENRGPGGEDVLMMSPGFPVSWTPPGADGHWYEYLRFGLHRPADVLAAVHRFRQRGLVP